MTNVDNFSFKDILTLFKLNMNATLDEFKDRASEVLLKSSDDNRDLLTKAIKKGIDYFDINKEGFSNKKDSEKDSGKYSEDDSEDDGEDDDESDDDKNAFMLTSRTKANTNINVDTMKGSLNPNVKQTIKQMVSIDSTFIKNVPTFGQDYTEFYKQEKNFSTNLDIQLFEPLTNVQSIKLHTIQISGSWFPFDHSYGTTVFWYKKTNAVDYNESNALYINIGYYSSVNDIISEMISQINKNIYDGTNEIKDLFNFVNIDYNSEDNDLTNRDISSSFINSNAFLLEYIDTSGDIMFYDTQIKPERKYYGKTYANHNLGWYLGFRNIHEINNETGKDVRIDISNGSVSNSPPDIHGSRHFFLSLDDLNKNQGTKGMISNISSRSDINIPSKHKALNSHQELYDNNEYYMYNSKRPMRRIIPNPTEIKQSEIYSINEILRHKKIYSLDTYLTHRNIPDVLAVIPLIASNVNTTEPYILSGSNIQSNERAYFGPVNIERLRVKLYDDKGYLVNLHGNNWSFTFIVERLYQYIG